VSQLRESATLKPAPASKETQRGSSAIPKVEQMQQPYQPSKVVVAITKAEADENHTEVLFQQDEGENEHIMVMTQTKEHDLTFPSITNDYFSKGTAILLPKFNLEI
jgi:hypothetical protein